jgi:hypothetical protein
MAVKGINSRLQKGGALLGDMRRLVGVWPPELRGEDISSFVMKALAKPSLARARETYIRVFRPRFLEGDPPQAWRQARVLEDAGVNPETARAFYLWITARAERLVYEYVTNELMEARATSDQRIDVEDAMRWLRSRLQATGKEWSPTVTRKVARGLLASLRDFGILQGVVVKTIAPPHCPPDAFALIAFVLHSLGTSGQALLDHRDWRLFLFNGRDVERAFLECHQRGWLNFQAAGAICRIDFPKDTLKEYARVVLD